MTKKSERTWAGYTQSDRSADCTRTEAFQDTEQAVQQYLPPEVHDLIRDIVISLYRNSLGARIVGFSVLL